jgi:hypothetical protein
LENILIVPKVLVFIFLFLSSKIFAQSDSLIWKTNNELGVVSYNVQQSSNQANWINISNVRPLKKDSNTYSYQVSVPNYYRISANMANNIYYTGILYYTPQVQNSVTVSNQKVSTSWWSDKLTWVTTKESNVTYYLIEYSSGTNWVTLTKIVDKGNSSYSYSNSRGWFSKKPNYRITGYFKDGTPSPIVYF